MYLLNVQTNHFGFPVFDPAIADIYLLVFHIVVNQQSSDGLGTTCKYIVFLYLHNALHYTCSMCCIQRATCLNYTFNIRTGIIFQGSDFNKLFKCKQLIKLYFNNGKSKCIVKMQACHMVNCPHVFTIYNRH